MDLNHPEKSGLYGARNFYITYHDPKRDLDVKLGVWHVLPNHIVKKFSKQLSVSEEDLLKINSTEKDHTLDEKNRHAYTEILKRVDSDFVVPTNDEDNDDVEIIAKNQKLFFETILKYTKGAIVFYLHGNTASRGATHRVEMYQTLRKLGYHVIAFDYRGYGDSSSLGPSARSVVLDALHVYKYILDLTDMPVLLWGHSLGTGVATHLMSDLKDSLIKQPRCMVLESPFNNIKDEVTEHPFARLYRHLPWFEFTILNPMYENQLAFDSDKKIADIQKPIMILHAEDDRVVPFKLGYQLYKAALKIRPKNFGPIELHRFAKKHQFGHKWLCRAPEFGELVNQFFEKYEENY